MRVLVLLLAGFAVQAEDVAFSLVAQWKGERPGIDFRMADVAIRAEVDGIPYRVKSVEDVSAVRKVVVIDLASIEPGARADVLSELAGACRGVAGCLGGAELMVVGADASGAGLGRFVCGNPACALWRAEGGGVGRLKVASNSKPNLGESRASSSAFRGLLGWIEEGSGPVMVFWFGQRFKWFQTRQAFTESEYGGIAEHEELNEFLRFPPNAAFSRLEMIGRKGVTAYPVVWRRGAVAGFDKWAEELGRMTGGEVHRCGGAVVACIEGAMGAAERAGVVLRMEGPRVGRRRGLFPRQLTLTVKSGGRTMRSSRDFVIGSDLPEAEQQAVFDWPPMELLFAEDLRPGSGGCPKRLGEAPAVAVRIPTRVAAMGLAGLRTFRSVLDGEGRELKWKVRGSDVVASAGCQEDVCVALPAPAGRQRMRLILFRTDLHWAGVAELGRGDTEEAQGRPLRD